MKRVLALVLALCLTLGAFPVVSFAEEPEKLIPTEEAYAENDALWGLIYAREEEMNEQNSTKEEVIQAIISLIEDAEIYADGSLERFEDGMTWKTTGGIACYYSFEEEVEDRGESKGNPIVPPESGYEHISYREKGSPNGADVYLIGPYYGVESDFTDHYKNEAKAVAAATGGTYTLYSYKNATIDNVAYAFSNGAIVLVDSHGTTNTVNGKTRSYLRLQTSTGITTEDYNNGWAYSNGSAYMVTGDAIASHMTKDAPNSFVWYGICSGMAYNSMSAPVCERGVEACFGYSRTVSFHYDRYWLSSFLDGIIAGKTVADAIATMKSEVGRWDRCDETAYNTLTKAINNNKAFPIVVSDEDTYPSNPEGLQTVYSTWTLYSCDHNNVSYVPATSASCTVSGCEAHYCCNDCQGCFADSACTTELNKQALTIPATGHSMVAGICATCGYVEGVNLWHFWDGSVESKNTWNIYAATNISVNTSDRGLITSKVSMSSDDDHYLTLNEDIGYKVQSGDVIEVRFRCTKAQTSAASFLLWYTKVANQTSFSSNSTKLSASVTFAANTWTTVSFTPTAGETVYRLLIDVFETDSNFDGATLDIDYIYMGPADRVPSKQANDSLFFDFTDDFSSQLRYAGSVYNDRPYDRGFWASNSSVVSNVSYDGNGMILTLADGANVAYAQTSDSGLTLSAKPLSYDPSAGDMVQIRFKAENLMPVTGSSGELRLYHISNDGSQVDSAAYTVLGGLDSSDLKSGTYITLTAPACDNFIAANVINAIRPQFANVTNIPGKTGKITIDYIFVGQSDALPEKIPEITEYAVTFMDQNGNVLQVLTVPKDTAADFMGTLPSKAYDNTFHYNFAGWVDAQGNEIDLSYISADLTVYASFSAEVHGNFSYSRLNTDYHTALCSCGFSKRLSHDWDEGKITSQPSCEKTGVKTYTCNNCDAAKTETLSALGHKIVAIPKVYPTCTESGLTEGSYCSTCGKTINAQMEIPASGHDYRQTVKEATCLEGGYTTNICKTCGDTFISNELAPTGHSYNCIDVGAAHLFVCSGCGDQYAQFHSWDDGVVISEQSCTQDKVTVFTCTICGGEERETVAARGHSMKFVPEKSASCTEDGHLKYYFCSRCNGYFSDEKGEYPLPETLLRVPATGHSEMEERAEKAPTCVENGYLKHFYCRSCGKFFADAEGQYEIPVELIELAPTGHINLSTTTNNPTCNDSGSIIVSCICGEVISIDTIPALGHSYKYTDNGSNHIVTCLNGCGYNATEAHSYENGICICGGIEVTEPVLDSNITIGEQLFLESDLTINFRIKESQLMAYDLATAYLVVERDIYATDGTMEVDVQIIRNFTRKDNRLVFVYSGIAASQMNDEIRITLYIKDANGKEYMSQEKVTSITLYAKTLIETMPSGYPKLYTVLMDMLNYGTAAQTYFKRHMDAPANKAYSIFSKYASYASADLNNPLENLSGQVENPNAGAYMNQALELGTRIGITYKVTLPSGVDAKDAVLVVKDENGAVLEDIALVSGTLDSKGRYVVNFYGNASRQMRRVVSATVYVNGAAISNTYHYSISTYAYEVANTAGMPNTLLELTKYMVIYGDSAAVYFG